METLVKKSFPVSGLSCASCAVSVESMLKSQKGVVNASVNYANSTAYVEYMPKTSDLTEFKTAVQSIGYDLLIEEENHDLHSELHQKQLKQLRNNTIGASILALPVVAIAMFLMQIPYANWIMLVLTTPVVFWFGRFFFINAYKQARHLKANMDTLVALSTGIAYLFSTFNTVYPEFWLNRGLHPHVYFEASAVVISFILIGRLLEERAKSGTSFAIKKLMGLQPNSVIKMLDEGHEIEIPIAQVKANDNLLVRPGDKIPVDGEILTGSSFIDESTITGESLPIEKKPGDKVYAGTINQKGSFVFTALKVGGDTILSQIIKMVQEAQGSKPPVQRLVDKIAGIFVPVVIGISILSFILWILFAGDNAVTHALLAMVTVLVIACPCALGLATPTSIMVGIGKGAESGILIKDAESLELSHKIDAIILDKTGTITEGHPEVTDIQWNVSGQEQVELIQIFTAIELQSEHPLAEAITNALSTNNKKRITFGKFESITGKGVMALDNNCTYLVGNRKLMDDYRVNIPVTNQSQVETWQNEAKTIVYFARNTDLIAVIGISDKIKITSAQAVENLHRLGIDVYMLSGDNEQTTRAVAQKLNLKKFKSEVLPSDKASFVQELQNQGKVVAMVGDGINDSHALAQADVSIAMGKGSDIAMDVAKMTIISSDLQLIPKAIRLSQLTTRAIRQNLFWAFIYNLLGIPIAAGILYPVWGFMLNPMIAGAAMALSSISVVSNSLRLKVYRL